MLVDIDVEVLVDVEVDVNLQMLQDVEVDVAD